MSKSMKKMVGMIALALVCALTATGLMTFRSPSAASAETEKVIVTSPFTAAIAKVRNSVVGVNNYQIVNTYGSSSGSNGYDYGGYSSPWDFFFGYGNGGSYGYGYGNPGGRSNPQPESKEVHYGSGSGVVVAKEYVLTNYHVVDNANSLKIAVTTDDSADPILYEATVAASDAGKDVAVLYVPGLPLDPVVLGDSDALVVGDWAICIGNPGNGEGLTMTNTVTAGIISALDREIGSANGVTTTDKYGRKTAVTNKMIQTDAAINNGNSGGGLFNVAGELVGIPNMKYSGNRSSLTSSGMGIENMGLAVPINEAKPVIEEALNKDPASLDIDVKANEEKEDKEDTSMVGKPRLGITANTFKGAEYSGGIWPNGVIVLTVEENGPAAKAGLQPGDVIMEINDTVTPTFEEMKSILSGLKEGDTINMKIWRPDSVQNPGESDMTMSRSGKDMDFQATLEIVD